VDEIDVGTGEAEAGAEAVSAIGGERGTGGAEIGATGGAGAGKGGVINIGAEAGTEAEIETEAETAIVSVMRSHTEIPREVARLIWE
jgi:hypothetical protein